MQAIRQEVRHILTSSVPNKIIEHLPLVLWFLSYLLTNVYPQLLRICSLRFPLIVEVPQPQSPPDTSINRAATVHSVSDRHPESLISKLYQIFAYVACLPTSWLNGLITLLKSYALNFLQLQLPLRMFSRADDRGAIHRGNKSRSLWRYFCAALFTSGASVFVHANKVSLINTLINYIDANYNIINHEVSIFNQYVNRRRLLVEYLCAFISNVLANALIQCVHVGVDVNGNFWRHLPSTSEWKSTRQLGNGNLFSRLYANVSLALYLIYAEIMTLRNPWMCWVFRIRSLNSDNNVNDRNTNNSNNNNNNDNSHNNNSNNTHYTTNNNNDNINTHSSTSQASSNVTPETNYRRQQTNNAQSLRKACLASTTDVVYVNGNDVFNCALAGFRLAYRGEASHLLTMLYLHLNNSTQLSLYYLLNRWYGKSYQWSPLNELPNSETAHRSDIHASTSSLANTSTGISSPSSQSYGSENGLRSYLTLHHMNDVIHRAGRSVRDLLTTASQIFTYGNAITDVNNLQMSRSSSAQSSQPSPQVQQQRNELHRAQVQQHEVNRATPQESTMMSLPHLREYVLLSASSFSLISFNWWHFSSGILVGLLSRKLTEYWSNNQEYYPELQKVVEWLFPSPVRIPELMLRNASASDGVCRIYSDDPEVMSILHRTHNATATSTNTTTHAIDINTAINDSNNSAPLLPPPSSSPSSSSSLSLQRYLLAPLQRLRAAMSSSRDNNSVSNEITTTVGNSDPTHERTNRFVVAEIPISSDCFCPISLTVMTDPVSTVDGFTYERSAIEHWFTQQQTSPMTNLRLNDLTLTSNSEVRTKVAAAAQQCNNILRELRRAL